MGTSVKKFSGGMKRKLEIVRGLMHRPKVLFLDEPTLGLDPASRRALWAYMKKVRFESGTTLFLTTHYLEEAEEADTICIINRGKIVSFGSTVELKADLIEEFLLIDADDRTVAPNGTRRTWRIQFSEIPPFKVSLNRRSAHQILKSIDTPLTSVVTHTPSLEDAYLEIVEQS